jgi:hypothetical protein
MALIYPIDAPYYTLDSRDPAYFTDNAMNLKAMQDLVGGYIECVALNPPVVELGATFVYMIVNEEGKLDGLPVNRAATDIAHAHGLQGDYIVGPAILLEDHEFQ